MFVNRPCTNCQRSDKHAYCGKSTTLYCDIGSALNLASQRTWLKDGSSFGHTVTPKYTEGLDNTATFFSLTINPFEATDAGVYHCQYGFASAVNSRYVSCQGVELRTARRFARRSYFASGPNFIWHIDGYDKLKPFGLCIHGCICGFSRKIIWLNVYKTNNNPRVVGSYFLEAVRHYGGTPRMIRGDFGTEKVLVERMQLYFRNDESSAYIDGASTQNQRIECWWGYLRRQHMQFYIDLFKDLQDRNEFSGSDLDKSLIQFCFMAVIQGELDLATTVWNNHSIRRSRNTNTPNGQPNRMFRFPCLWNTRNYMCAVSQNHTDAFQDEVEFRSLICCDQDVYEMCTRIMADDNLVPAKDSNEALTLFRHIKSRI